MFSRFPFLFRSSHLAGRFRNHLFELGEQPTARSSLWTHTERLRLSMGSNKRLQQKTAFHLPVWYVFWIILYKKKNTASWITIWCIATFIHFAFFTESGRSIACAGRNTTLRCDSGRVLMIDGGFYGRKNIHYCRSPLLTSPTQIQCGWVDAAEALRGKNTVRLFLCAIQTCIISILCSCLSCYDNLLFECYTITQPSAVNWSDLHNNHSQLESGHKHWWLMKRFCMDEYRDETQSSCDEVIAGYHNAHIVSHITSRECLCPRT